MDKAAAMERIKAIIEEQNAITIAAEADGIEVDSLTILLIFTYARETLGISLDSDKLDFDNFASLATIEDTVFSGRYLVDLPA